MMRTLQTFLLAASLCVLSATAARAAVNFSITVAPPLLPVYAQPLCPEDGYLWTPGYWDYDDGGYYWVPGAWVLPPRIGFLWTPGYWAFDDGFYRFRRGYWGSRVGFYGGVNYGCGCGYGGYGYGGGAWRGNRFAYNTAVTRVNTTVIHNTYIDRSVRERGTGSRASFNGRGGVNVRPTAEQRQIAGASHVAPTGAQVAHRQAASRDEGARAAANRGRPANPAVDPVRERGVNERADRQAARTANGVRDGQISQREAQRFGNRDANIERQANRERRANGGDGLTREERQLAERREKRVGRDIRAERQEGRQAQERGQRSYEAGRRAEGQQMRREAAGQRAQAGERQARQPQPQQQAQRQERQAERGGGQGEHRGKGHGRDGQDRQ